MKTLLSLSMALVLANCSTIINGTEQEVHILNPVQECVVEGEGQLTQEILVKRSKEGFTIVCHIEPTVTFEAQMSAILFDYGIVDAATGAMWGYPDVIDLLSLKEYLGVIHDSIEHNEVMS